MLLKQRKSAPDPEKARKEVHNPQASKGERISEGGSDRRGKGRA